jgi:hypothetical protein
MTEAERAVNAQTIEFLARAIWGLPHEARADALEVLATKIRAVTQEYICGPDYAAEFLCDGVRTELRKMDYAANGVALQ